MRRFGLLTRDSRVYRRRIRKISGLLRARFIETPSWTVGARTRKGKIARGRAYERAVGRELERQCADHLGGDLYLQPWVGYEDANGEGIAQPDALIDFPDCILLLEIKLKQSPLAREQIDRLYRPLISHMFKKQVIGVEVFKYPAHGRDAAWVKDLKTVANRKRDGLWIWHYLG